ncbi:hypothetical protein VNO78_30839 [Psophocarpus tetragonolobus]|uniref:Uncharacterized protein n=1 Tax=Psophocarpus tetragonolobus TaxID=3891 RepID=A0AAN9RY39_PSOTE
MESDHKIIIDVETIDLDDMSENPKGCDSEYYRSERRWKRRELSNSNNRMKHNHSDSGARSTVKGHRNMTISTEKNGHGNVVNSSEEKGSGNLTNSTGTKDHENVVISTVEKSHRNVSNSTAEKGHGDVSNSIAKKDGRVSISTGTKANENGAILKAQACHGNVSNSTAKKGGQNLAILTGAKGHEKVPILTAQTGCGNVAIAEKSHEKVEISTRKKGHRNMAISTAGYAHVLYDDEMDEDYKLYLTTHYPDSDDNVNGSDSDINVGCNTIDHNDCPWGEEERLHNDPKLHKGSKQRKETGNQGNKASRKLTSGPSKCRHNLGAKRRLSKKRPREDVSCAPENNCCSNMRINVVVDEDYEIFLNSLMDDYIPSELIGSRSSDRQNSQVSCYGGSEVDEDYLEYLNSVMIFDGEVECIPERNTSRTNNVDGDNNSSDSDFILSEPSQIHESPERNTLRTDSMDIDSDSSESDLILLDPNQIHQNTPFVSSKAYDLSCFKAEKNPKENWQLSACDNSQFRRRLMDDLQRPYDQEECDRLLHEVQEKKEKERHAETRRGVIKSYRAGGVSKSYLELYPDLADAITKFKQPERVLFLLRGFVFWLQNLTHQGIFRPWLDEECLNILIKM